MEAIVLNKVPSNTASAKAIVLDKIATPPFTAAVSAKFYWRFEDEPTSPYQYLGQQAAGFPFQVPFDPQGREIRISVIGVSAAGIQSAYDPREGVQTTITPPSQVSTIVSYGGQTVFYNNEAVTYG